MLFVYQRVLAVLLACFNGQLGRIGVGDQCALAINQHGLIKGGY